MNLEEKSVRELTRILEEYEISAEEWNEYAKQKHLSSTINLMIHFKVEKWEEVKYKANKKNRHINKKIEQTREDLYKSIEKNGLSSMQTRELSDKIDRLIATYYKDNRDKEKGKFYAKGAVIDKVYDKSYQYLKSLTVDLNEFPTIDVWDKFARKSNCLSSTSMQYISGLNWHKLRDRIKSNVVLRPYKNVKK